eukprot:5104898-Pleurochrysis_carterae.AAC.1
MEISRITRTVRRRCAVALAWASLRCAIGKEIQKKHGTVANSTTNLDDAHSAKCDVLSLLGEWRRDGPTSTFYIHILVMFYLTDSGEMPL